jgi:RNA polymerase sigma-70 factor (ECF subfamily)
MTAQRQSGSRNLPREFEEMFLEHHDLVYRTAFRVTGNAEDAEDVLQTLFLRLLRRDCPPDIATSPRAYLHRAAVNIALDIIKVRTRHVSAEEMDFEDSRPAPDRERNSSEIQAWLRKALSELSPKTAEMFVLRHVEGYDNSEIARMLKTSRGTVAVMLFRARLRLQKSLKSRLGMGKPTQTKGVRR